MSFAQGDSTVETAQRTSTTTTNTGGAMSPLISTTEVTAVLGRTRQTVCAWARQGLIPTIRMLDRNYMFSRVAIETWITGRSTL